MTTYSIQLKETDRQKIDAFIQFVKSLDFVQSVEAFAKTAPSKKNTGKTANTDGYLSVDEIRRQFPNEWVLLANPVAENVEILGGTVILHDPEKRNMALRGRDLIKKYARVTHFFTGEMPKRATIGLMRKVQTAQP